MSKFQKLWCDYGPKGYAQFDPGIEIDEHFADVAFFKGTRLRASFPPTRIVLKSRPKPPDYLRVGSLEIVSDRLRTFLEQERVNAEFLEVEVYQKGASVHGAYYFMNPLDVIPCLDRTRSVFEEDDSGPGPWIWRIYELYLDESRIGDRRLFVLDEKILLLIRDDLAEALRAASFTGIAFKQLPKGPF